MTFLADSGKVALITGEYEDFHLQLGNILQDPHIDSVFILKPDGRVAASNRADSVGGSVPEPRGRPHLDSRRQDITANDLNIGTVVAWFSNAGLVASIDAARRRGIQIAIAGMIGIAIVGLFIGFALSRRLEKLAAAADQYVVGGLSVEVDAQGRDETARLARSFRTMAARIQDHVVKLGTELERTALGQKALADSEARYRGLFEGAWLGIQITLLDGTRLLANQALVGLLGYCSVEELMKLPRRGLIAPYDRNRFVTGKMMLEAETALPHNYEIDLVRKDRSTFPAQVIWRNLEWQGQPAIERIFIDISERKRAQEALTEREEHSRLLLNTINDGLFGLDLHGNFTFCNPAGLRLLGFEESSELIGRNMHALTHHSYADGSPYQESGCRVHQAFLEGRQIEADDEIFWRPDGTQFPVAFRSLPARKDGRIVGAVVTFCDLTKRHEDQKILHEHDQTIRDLQTELARASRISAMGEVSSVIAYELHQPLTAIRNTASAAQRHLANASGDTTDLLGEMLPLIAAQADRAGRVIKGIRELFEGGRRDRTEETLNVIIDEACDLAAREFEPDGVFIERQFSSNLPTVSVDKIQIQQVVYNLLRNAVEAVRDTPERSVIVTTSMPDDRTIEVSVQDSGPGVPAGKAATIFDPFVTTKDKGMGMGLHTCRTIVEAHAGRIWADEPDGNGARFRFAIPAAAIRTG